MINSFSLECHISYYDVPDSEVSSLKTHRMRTIVLLSPIKLNVTPSVVRDLQSFAFYLENFYIMSDLKKFRPVEDLCMRQTSYSPSSGRK